MCLRYFMGVNTVNKRNEMIVDWAVKKIEKEYKGEVALLLTYGSYENGTSNPLSDVDFYFIPKIEHAYKLSKTFIVEGIGFDLFPMSWERVAGLAEINECLTPCLANVKVLYCDSEEDICELRTLAGDIVMFLSDAVAYANQTYFKGGLKKQLEDLKNINSSPKDFVLLYESVIKANSEKEIKEYCYNIIKNTRNFLNSKSEKSKKAEKKVNWHIFQGHVFKVH